jgi:aspartate racemase
MNDAGMDDRPVLGILGGMGPLASAELLRTIYALSPAAIEQEMPAVVLISDPTMPDRTEALRRGDTALLLSRLNASLEQLRALRATRIVIACMTIHQLLPRVPLALRRDVISLVDVAIGAMHEQPGRFLLLATEGTRAARLFERHPRWAGIAARACWPDPDDQRLVHELIYRTKGNASRETAAQELRALLRRYDTDTFVAGCTELHLVGRSLAPESAPACIDPLTILAREVATNPRWPLSLRWQSEAA